MADKFISERNLQFLLYEVFDVVSLTQYPYYKAHNRKVFDMVLKEAVKLAKSLLRPVFAEMDQNQPDLIDGEIKVHPSIRKIMKEFGEGGWITSTLPFEKDGEQLPHLIAGACSFIFQAANYAAVAYQVLTAGAAHLIESFGSKDLYDIYTPKMHAGKWQGTMALTESEAGSSLSDITTWAEPTDHGYHMIKGQKIFISAGDHDGVENVVHLMLAKIKGAPPGVKGISLFVVPKKRFDPDGKLISNDVIASGVYHKLGYRGCPTTQLSIGDHNDCRGWLVGEPHNGLRYMFQMINESRIMVGLGANAIATAAYYASLEYANTRRQGRKISQKDPTLPPVTLIEHADIKRMLLFQRAITEGALSLLMQCSRYVDMQNVLGGEEKEKYHLLLEILTPVAKTYPSEMGVLSVSQGLQCFGGSGYCDDYPMEHHYRDARIHPIHEGTTGIQAMDLLGRKMVMKNGQAFAFFLAELKETISAAGQFPELDGPAQQLSEALSKLQKITEHLLKIAQEKGVELFMADATLYLELFGHIAIAWQWLLQGISIQKALNTSNAKTDFNYYKGKMVTMHFFFRYELPKILGLEKRLMDSDGLTVEMEAQFFND